MIDLLGPHGPTVTGTANVLSAAVLARGRTIIRNAALEPEIVDLGRMLGAMGARIAGLGTTVLEIDGVDQLAGCRWDVIPDRIEAATFMLAAAITGGEVCVAGVLSEHVEGDHGCGEATAGQRVHGQGDCVSDASRRAEVCDAST